MVCQQLSGPGASARSAVPPLGSAALDGNRRAPRWRRGGSVGRVACSLMQAPQPIKNAAGPLYRRVGRRSCRMHGAPLEVGAGFAPFRSGRPPSVLARVMQLRSACPSGTRRTSDTRFLRLLRAADARLDDVGQPHLGLADPYGIRVAGRVELVVSLGLGWRRGHADHLVVTEDSEAHAQAGQTGRGAQLADRHEELPLAVVHVALSARRPPNPAAPPARTLAMDREHAPRRGAKPTRPGPEMGPNRPPRRGRPLYGPGPEARKAAHLLDSARQTRPKRPRAPAR